MISEFSNSGTQVDLSAPGGGADAALEGDARCDPDAAAPGRDVFQLTFVGTSPRVFGLPDGYQGTSMATPHVTGAAALAIASGAVGVKPSPAQLLAHLQRTARDLGAPGRDNRYGAGLLDAAAATTRG